VHTIASLALDALAYGMVLFTITIGLSLTMGLMRVVNLAHGAFAMIGGYLASYAIQSLGLSYGAAILAAIGGTLLVAMPLERLLYRRIYATRDPLPQVLMTIGITFCIIGIANFLFGPTLKTIPLPTWLAAPVDLGFAALAGHRLLAIGSGGALALGLWLLLQKTRFGINLRAVVDDPAMAAALGLPIETIYAMSFALAVALAASSARKSSPSSPITRCVIW